jgi:ribosomal-protein-alanine N-acetyltransferase
VYYFIEPMFEEDIEQVQNIERNSFSTPWSVNTYRNELRNVHTSRYIVARASHTPPPPREDFPPRRSLLSGLLPAFLFAPRPSIPSHSSFPIVGYAGIWLNVSEAHITTIAVAPEYRGRGVGELLLNHLIEEALALNSEMLTLEVRVSNTVAQKLYLKYGFRPAGTRPRYYTDNNEDALLMWADTLNTPEFHKQLQRLRETLFIRLRKEADAPPPVGTTVRYPTPIPVGLAPAPAQVQAPQVSPAPQASLSPSEPAKPAAAKPLASVKPTVEPAPAKPPEDAPKPAPSGTPEPEA